jgi:hypothetical protein
MRRIRRERIRLKAMRASNNTVGKGITIIITMVMTPRGISIS